MTGCVMLSEAYPYAPICIFMIFLPAWLIGIHHVVLASKIEMRHYLGALPGPMALVGISTLFAWVYWMAQSEAREWGPETRFRYGMRTCGKEDPSYESGMGSPPRGRWGKVKDSPLYDDLLFIDCLDGFMLWISPFVAALVTLFYGFLAYFLDDNVQHKASNYFGYALCLLGGGLWCAASITGAGSGLTEAFFAVIQFGVIGLGLMVVGTFGFHGLAAAEKELVSSPYFKEMVERYGWVEVPLQGLFVVTSSPVFLAYLFIAWLNQLARKCGMGKDVNEEEKKLRFTQLAEHLIDKARGWEWSGVLKCGIVWGYFYMIMNVIVANFVNVFLSTLIEICQDIMDCSGPQTYFDYNATLSGDTICKFGIQGSGDDVSADADGFVGGFFVITLLILGVGLFLFLLPPVPGVPIYLISGLVLIAGGTKYNRDAEEGMGLYLALVVTVCCGLMLKLFACSVQQKCIGGFLKNKVWIRQAVGVNSDMVRTMRVVLSKPGLSMDKVSILVGGPDWPTSVLCGIMDLPLLPVLFGTLPVVFLIFPTVLAGTFMYLSSLRAAGSEYYSWASTASVITFAAVAGVQGGSMVVGTYYLAKAQDDPANQAELEKLPIDQEVKEADDKLAALTARYYEVRNWEGKGEEKGLSSAGRYTLVLAMVCMITSCYITSLATCFRIYALTDSISELPNNFPYCDEYSENDDDPGGNVICVMKPGGMIAVLIFAMSMFLHLIVFDQFIMRFALDASIKRTPLTPLSAEEAHAEAPGPTARERDLLAGGALAGAGIQLETFPLAEVATTAVAMENAIGTEPALGEAARAEE
mmetsp:Transcript_108661/g.316099  ORF Transcript_108661/g.316099 Transcript_108661/m.316099 type:complete len:811 (-) Transcript_108661:485-2917(-)